MNRVFRVSVGRNMAVEFQVFVKTESSFGEFVTSLNPIFSHALVKVPDVEWELYRGALLGVEISVYEAIDYVDDREMDFTAYDCVINFDCIPGFVDRTYSLDWQRSLSIAVASIVFNRLKCECMVVEDMKLLVANFPGPQV